MRQSLKPLYKDPIAFLQIKYVLKALNQDDVYLLVILACIGFRCPLAFV